MKNNRASLSKQGAKNGMWKENDAGYFALHHWVRRRLEKPTICSNCKKDKVYLDLANISGKYKRDLNDWEWLCRSCHMMKDGRIKQLNRKGNFKNWKAWNKGLPKEDQPNFGKVRSKESKLKMSLARKQYWENKKKYAN